MSGYILCQTKKADKPFFVESINTNIYSLEELCYFLYHNLYLVDSSIINENLCTWISEELDLPRLAAKLRPHLGKFASAEDVLYPVFKEINYLTYDELKALNVKLAKLDQEAPLLRKKRKGDALVANKMYVSAIKVYQQLLKKEGLTAAISGSGETVTGQIPSPGQTVPGGSQVLLFLGQTPEPETVKVPDFYGMNRQQASDAAGALGLYILVTGNDEISTGVTVTAQNVAKDTEVPAGTTITLVFADTAARD